MTQKQKTQLTLIKNANSAGKHDLVIYKSRDFLLVFLTCFMSISFFIVKNEAGLVPGLGQVRERFCLNGKYINYG